MGAGVRNVQARRGPDRPPLSREGWQTAVSKQMGLLYRMCQITGSYNKESSDGSQRNAGFHAQVEFALVKAMSTSIVFQKTL